MQAQPARQGPPQSLQYLSLRNSDPKVNQLLRCRPCFLVCHTVTDLPPPLLLPLPFLLFVIPWGSAVVFALAVAVAVSFGCHPVRDLLLPLPLPFCVSSTKETPFPHSAANHPTHRSFPHPSQFINSHLTPIHPRSTLCPYSTHWHL